MVKSKFSFISVYLALGVICFFIFIAIGALLVLGFQQSSSILIFAVAGIFAGSFLVRRMIVLKISPDRIELRGLLFRQTIFRDDIISIELTGNERISPATPKWQTGAVVIRWGKGDKIVLADVFYRNMPQLKRALYGHFLSSTTDTELFPDHITDVKTVPAEAEVSATVFTGHPLLNIQTIIFLAYIIFIAVAMRPLRADAGEFFYGGLLAALYLPMYITVGYRLFYFKVSEDYLIVKNYFFPWFTKGYRLEDISEIVIGISLRRGVGLRVNTRNFFSRRYSAGSLRKGDWKGLEQVLESRRVAVRNEIPS
jgi:hypothetical protein